MLSAQSLFTAAQIVALGTVFPLFPAHPFSVWSNVYNTGTLSTSLQHWRTLGRYYRYVDRKHDWQVHATSLPSIRFAKPLASSGMSVLMM